MRIYNNPAAFNTWRQLQITDGNISKDLEKLSSGLRINRAADDASGLATSEKMRNQIDGLKQASSNAQDGISLIQSAEGALDVVHEMLRRVRTLAVKGNNDTLTAEDRMYAANEIDQLFYEINAVIGEQTVGTPENEAAGGDTRTGRAEFNTRALFQASGGKGGVAMEDLQFQIGANLDQTLVLNSVANELAAIRALARGEDMNGFEPTDAETTLAEVFNGRFSVQDEGEAYWVASDGTSGIAGANPNAESAESEGHVSDAFRTLIEGMDFAISTVSSLRAKLGAYQNRLEYTVRNLNTITENTIIAESRVRDTDMVDQMSSFTRNNILLQSGTAMMAQANQKPQSVLRLLG